MGLIFRNDDVCSNTDIKKLHNDFYKPIHKRYPEAQIYSCVTLFSKESKSGSVYPDVPFKDKPIEYFMDVNRFMGRYEVPDYVTVVSHGTWHFDHSAIPKDVQYCSIMSSCIILKTRIFAPPFNRYNSSTEEICRENGIELLKPEDGWKSLEHNKFDKNHHLWYFHSWRWKAKEFMEHIK